MKSLPELLSLKGKCAIVTGAATGIGRAISARLAEAGANLILLDIDPKGLSQARADLTSPGSSVLAFKVDLSAKGNIDRFWSEIRGDQVGVLVNNAGVYPFKRFLDLEPDYLDQVMQVNLYSVLWMCQSMIKRRGKRGASSSISGLSRQLCPSKTTSCSTQSAKLASSPLPETWQGNLGRTVSGSTLSFLVES